MTRIDNVQLIEVPKAHDVRGNLSVIEGNTIPFEIKRVYWIYDVPGGDNRGGHSYYQNQELIIALSGSFDVVLDDGFETKKYTLNRSHFGLYVPNGIWRQLENFSTNSLAFIAASHEYNENDYLRNYETFKTFKES
jgi:mannose-6-phosphate isomerase-like protein (cupin superfamily)